MTYVVVSLVSSIIFLTAIGVIYAATGTVNMAQLAERLDQLPPDVQMILHVLLLIGFGIKAAIFPLSFWLPDSYPTAPAPVTAVFAGLLTKVGIYAIIRTETLLFADSSLRVPLLVAAGLTMIVGILGAIAQSEIKRIVSFTLVSHIGYMLFGVAWARRSGSPPASTTRCTTSSSRPRCSSRSASSRCGAGRRRRGRWAVSWCSPRR